MQNNIHPTWHDDCQVTCSCGNSFVTGSTQEEIEVEICKQCHPFFTGEMKFVDRQGRVDKFKQKMKLAQQKQEQAAAKRQQQSKQQQQQDDSQSYQDILRQAKSDLRKQDKQQ
jgi:large subunit ribosomal protein L31